MTKEEFFDLRISEGDCITFFALCPSGKTERIEKIRIVDYESMRINTRPIEELTYKSASSVLRSSKYMKMLTTQKEKDNDELSGVSVSSIEVYPDISRIPKETDFLGYQTRTKRWVLVHPISKPNGHKTYRVGFCEIIKKELMEMCSHFAILSAPETF